MELQLDLEGLDRLIQSFYDIAGIRIGVFSPDGRSLLAYPREECAMCQLVKSDLEFKKRCMENDLLALQRAMKGEQMVYRCHAGLYEAVTPILCDNTPLACLMIGQAAPSLPDEEMSQELAMRLNGHPKLEEILRGICTMPRRSEKELLSCAQIMAACAGYIYLNGMIYPQQIELSTRLNMYIQTQYTRPVTLKDMALELGVSVTRLCTTVKSELGTTPHAMLTEYRIEKSKQLLRRTKLPIQEIAASVGIDDYNYFSRVFRKATGKTPSEFRKWER